MSESNGNDPTPQNATQPPSGPPPPAAADLESGGGGGVSDIVERWKREDLLKKGSLASRVLGLIFSFLAFVIMATNKHGDWSDWRNFDHYDEYRYVVGVSILSTLYAALQSWHEIHKLKTSREMLPWQNLAAVEFCGDQISAYLLISAVSAAIPLTNSMRAGADNLFTDASAASISMAFFAFVSLAISSLISGYKLCKPSYI